MRLHFPLLVYTSLLLLCAQKQVVRESFTSTSTRLYLIMPCDTTTRTLTDYIVTALAVLVCGVSTFYLCSTRFNPYIVIAAVLFAIGLAPNVTVDQWGRTTILVLRTVTTIVIMFACTLIDINPTLFVLTWGVLSKHTLTRIR